MNKERPDSDECLAEEIWTQGETEDDILRDVKVEWGEQRVVRYKCKACWTGTGNRTGKFEILLGVIERRLTFRILLARGKSITILGFSSDFIQSATVDLQVA